MPSLIHSSLEILPFLIFMLETLASVPSTLIASCSLVISSEKKSTLRLPIAATFLAMFSAKEVLPIAGLAPTIIRSERLRPVSTLSRSLKPVV